MAPDERAPFTSNGTRASHLSFVRGVILSHKVWTCPSVKTSGQSLCRPAFASEDTNLVYLHVFTIYMCDEKFHCIGNGNAKRKSRDFAKRSVYLRTSPTFAPILLEGELSAPTLCVFLPCSGNGIALKFRFSLQIWFPWVSGRCSAV